MVEKEGPGQELHSSHSLSELTAVTPLDGRYRKEVQELSPFVSEYGLIRTRMEIEGKYLVALSDIGVVRPLSSNERSHLETVGPTLSLSQAEEVKKIEDETKHDVKAMEKVFRSIVTGTSLEDVVEMIHFGLTSEDINNLAYRLQLQRATQQIILPKADSVIDQLIERASDYKAEPMLARTHGQPAIPTTLGKEFVNVAVRLNTQIRGLEKQKLTGKLNGAVGNYSSLHYVFPDKDWVTFSENFVSSLGFEPNLFTTQINSYEDIIEYTQRIQRMNGVLLDFDQDMWRYISDDLFHQEVRSGETGSSTMSQKVNPIRFENSEGNIGIANTLIDQITRKLAVSRMQRDLSDSTVMRNTGVILGHTLLALKGTSDGIKRVTPNLDKISSMLNADWSILAEPVQTRLRASGDVEDPYMILKDLTHGGHLDNPTWQSRLSQLPVNNEEYLIYSKLTPQNYIGLAPELTDRAIAHIHRSRKG